MSGAPIESARQRGEIRHQASRAAIAPASMEMTFFGDGRIKTSLLCLRHEE
jgi:hypothetical protein